MKLLVVSSAPIVLLGEKKYLYGPYHKEMKIWAKYADEIQFCCPVWNDDRKLLVDEISFPVSEIIALKEFDITAIRKIPIAFFNSIVAFWIIVNAMRKADQIHLRCPGNIGLLASIAQILFPKKKKTAKYAGNWDPKSKQPWSYRLQKSILSNTFLTKNMQVLVYGDWPGQTKNIKPFFTATYSEKEIREMSVTHQELVFKPPFHFIFAGTLSSGKQPLYALALLKGLLDKGYEATLTFYGEGTERTRIEEYIREHNLEGKVVLMGNQLKEVILDAYKRSHFLILPSKSEGWPKVVAEAMVWGCLPLVTPVSCVPYMLGSGERGVLLTNHLSNDVNLVSALLEDPVRCRTMALQAKNWSRHFTTDAFELEIAKLLKNKQ